MSDILNTPIDGNFVRSQPTEPVRTEKILFQIGTSFLLRQDDGLTLLSGTRAGQIGFDLLPIVPVDLV